MSDSWNDRVRNYVDELERTVETIDSILERTQVDTTELNAGRVEQSLEPLQQALAELEERIVQREELLRAGDAPAGGLSLTEKLKSTYHVDDARLARRCEQVASRMAGAHQRAISLFVCQFHLSEFSSEMVRLLTGNVLPSTYRVPGRGTGGRSAGEVTGGLFNESA